MRCYSCKKDEMKPGRVEHVTRVGDQSFLGAVPGHVCPSCGESVVHIDAAQAFSLAVASHLAENGPPSPEGLRFMRKAIELTGVELADLLRTTKETVSRWETGKVAFDHFAWMTLGSLVLDTANGVTTTRDRLNALRRPALAKTVPIHVQAAAR